MKKGGVRCKILLKKGGHSVWAPKKLGLSVCENKIFTPKFAIFFAQIDIKLHNFLIAHEAHKFFLISMYRAGPSYLKCDVRDIHRIKSTLPQARKTFVQVYFAL